MVQLRPPMGVNLWNFCGTNINEKLIMETADAMVEEGLLEKGYEYLIIDDGWAAFERDENGRLRAHPEKFPSGMKALGDYIHSKGLKFGIYSCTGTMTCACWYPGSYEHEYVDAETFAEWGVDFLKHDTGFNSDLLERKHLYRRMGIALRNCGRDIKYAICTGGTEGMEEWAKSTGACMWRSGEDIRDTWDSIAKCILDQEKWLVYHGMGCYNDIDMMVVGLYGKGTASKKNEVCTDVQYRTHFSAWALLGSPLIIGCDVRNMNKATKDILMHEELIRINQDPLASQPVKIMGVRKELPDLPMYYRLLENGDLAIGFFNVENNRCLFRVNLDELGLPFSSGKTLRMKNLWTGEVSIVKNDNIFLYVEPCDCAVYRAEIIDK